MGALFFIPHGGLWSAYYCPTSQDRNLHADFSSGIMALAEFGTKKSRVYIVSKRKKDNVKFLFEESDFGYSFKEV